MATATLSAQPQAAGRQRPAPWSAARAGEPDARANVQLDSVRGVDPRKGRVAAHAARIQGLGPTRPLKPDGEGLNMVPRAGVSS
jgi:hypothetical protein